MKKEKEKGWKAERAMEWGGEVRESHQRNWRRRGGPTLPSLTPAHLDSWPHFRTRFLSAPPASSLA